jgi:3-polyprenyl-4-hydroxybenzoate decarboxylase
MATYKLISKESFPPQSTERQAKFLIKEWLGRHPKVKYVVVIDDNNNYRIAKKVENAIRN